MVELVGSCSERARRGPVRPQHRRSRRDRGGRHRTRPLRTRRRVGSFPLPARPDRRRHRRRVGPERRRLGRHRSDDRHDARRRDDRLARPPTPRRRGGAPESGRHRSSDHRRCRRHGHPRHGTIARESLDACRRTHPRRRDRPDRALFARRTPRALAGRTARARSVRRRDRTRAVGRTGVPSRRIGIRHDVRRTATGDRSAGARTPTRRVLLVTHAPTGRSSR